MTLNAQQQAALRQLLDFCARREGASGTALSLQGGAGVGKTYLVGQLVRELQQRGQRALLAAPTHKACRVLRQKLDAWGVRWVFKPKGEVPPSLVVVDTTAALLGIRPVVDDDQEEDELKFKSTGAGSVGRLFEGDLGELPPVLLIDEVSMLGREDLLQLADAVRSSGGLLVCVGDEGQLPPVKKQAIDFASDFDEAVELTEVVRQKAGSSIVALAWAIRRGEDPHRALDGADLLSTGADVKRVDSVSQAYLAQLELPVVDEGQRSVYIAYRNAVVDQVQELCCQKLYGHGAADFVAGELVLSSRAGYREDLYWTGNDGRRRLSRWPKMTQLVANADQLRVVGIGPAEGADPVYGRPVELDRVDLPEGAADRRFTSHYLSEAELADEAHPFRVRKAELLKRAKELQQQHREKPGNADVDQRRKDAWGEFFKHEQRVVGFGHPFAITSHKSQGSTYRAAYVNAGDLLRFDRRALYVAVTRPSERLVI